MKYTVCVNEAKQLSNNSSSLIPTPNPWMVIRACAKIGCRSAIIERQSFDEKTEKELKEMGYKVKKISNKIQVSWE